MAHDAQDTLDLRMICDLGDKHRPNTKRWSWEWMQYFHLCPKCANQWDR